MSSKMGGAGLEQSLNFTTLVVVINFMEQGITVTDGPKLGAQEEGSGHFPANGVIRLRRDP